MLRQEFTNETQKSNQCKNLCINEGKNFCTNSAFNGGYCCESAEVCPRAIYCSYDNPKAPNEFKYLVCPNEPVCGYGKILIPKYDGTVTTRTISRTPADKKYFLKDDICSYIIQAPSEMKAHDHLKVKITKIRNCDVYLAYSKRYRWLTHTDHFFIENN